MTVQLILGIYLIVYTATREGGSVTECHPRFLTMMFQSNLSYFRFIWGAFWWDMSPWNSDLLSYLSYTVRGFSRSSYRRHPPWSSRRPSSLFTHRLSRGAVKRKQGPDSETVQDYSTRCDVLFPVYIHFTSRGRAVSVVRKCKHIFTILYPLSTVGLDLCSPTSRTSLPRKC